MNKAVFFIVVFTFTKLINAQHFEWARTFGGLSSENANDVAIDAAGNVYTVGRFKGTVDFDPGAGSSILTSVGTSDCFVQKLNTAGDFIWVKGFGANSSEFLMSMLVDASGGIYTAGFFWATVDFDPGAGTLNLTSTGDADCFIQKLDTSGNFVWAKSFGGASADIVRSIASDVSGNLYTIGNFIGTVDFDPGPGTVSLISAGNNDCFIQKFDAAGSLQWAISFGGTDAENGAAISTDASGNIYTVGNFQGTVDFDPDTTSVNYTSSGLIDCFVQKFSQPISSITVSASMLPFSQIIGNPSAEQSFSISGVFLTDNITVSASSNYEVSLTSGSGFSGSLQVNQLAGVVPNTTIYVRLNAATIGTYNGNIILTSDTLSETIILTGEAIQNTTGLNEIGLNTIQVYPNPSTGIIVLTVTEPTTVVLASSSGSVVTSLDLKGETSLDISAFTAGLYFIITSEGQTIKFIKE